MKSLFSFSLLLLAACGLMACGGSKTYDLPADASPDSLDRVFENAYLRIAYSSAYEVDADFSTGTLTAEETKALNDDSVALALEDAMGVNSLNIYPREDNADYHLPEIRIVLSRYRFYIPLKEMMQLTIMSKEVSGGEDDLHYIGCGNVDSLTFAGYPALAADFVYRTEAGDTVAHKQIMMMQEDYTFYYINLLYGSDESYKLGLKMLTTLSFAKPTEAVKEEE